MPNSLPTPHAQVSQSLKMSERSKKQEKAKAGRDRWSIKITNITNITNSALPLPLPALILLIIQAGFLILPPSLLLQLIPILTL